MGEEVDAALARGEGVAFETGEDFMTHLRKLDREASERGDAAAGAPEPAARRSARGQRDQPRTQQQRSPRGGDVSALEDLPSARTAIRLRHHREVVTLDQRRALLELVAAGATARDIGALLGISQHAVTGLLQRAEGTPPVLEGFSGATPLEIAQRYAAGLIPREQVVAELVAFPYTPMPTLTGWEDPLVLPAGTWQDVSEAQGRGLIDIDIYDEVHTQRRANRTGATAQRSITGEPVESQVLGEDGEQQGGQQGAPSGGDQAGAGRQAHHEEGAQDR